MKTVEFSCDERLLEMAEIRAAREHSNLKFKFQEWLEAYTKDAETPEEAAERRKQQAKRAIDSIRYLRRKYPPQGRKFTREEMNERR